MCLACFMFCATVLFPLVATNVEYWVITSSLQFLDAHLVFFNDVLVGKLLVDKRKCHFQVPGPHE